MPFGMVNSGAILKRGLRKVLSDMDNVVFYRDDILVHTKTWEQLIKRLRELFQKQTKAHFTVRPSKCIFESDDVHRFHWSSPERRIERTA